MAAVKNNNGGGIQTLPEACLAEALSLTSPKDVCRLSVVHSSFRDASSSDTIWERFLPSDYREIIVSRAVDGEFLERFQSKKELYFHLCDHPLPIDGGLKSFSLDKASGKKCFVLSARDLSIVWGNTPQYWQWIPSSISRFPEVAELLSVCWLEITAEIDLNLLSEHTIYGAYLVFAINPRAYGFDLHPAVACVEKHNNCCSRSIWLDQNGRRKRQRHRPFFRAREVVKNGVTARERGDGWMEVELGEVYVADGDDGNLQMSLREVEKLNWKSGLLIQGIEVRPKD